jgi:hypothetical protein
MSTSSKNNRKHQRDEGSAKAIWSDFLDLAPGDLDTLLQLDNRRLTKLLAHLANQGNVQMTSLKRARTSLLASFSSTTWANMAEEPSLKLASMFAKNDFGELDLRECRLPPSFFKPLLATAWRFIDVYQEPGDQTREASRLRIFDPVRCSRLVTRSRIGASPHSARNPCLGVLPWTDNG